MRKMLEKNVIVIFNKKYLNNYLSLIYGKCRGQK